MDRKHQALVLLFMVLGSEDVGRCRMGEPTPRTFVVFARRSSSCLTSNQNTVFERPENIFWSYVQNRPCRARGFQLYAAFVLMLWYRLRQCEPDNCVMHYPVIPLYIMLVRKGILYKIAQSTSTSKHRHYVETVDGTVTVAAFFAAFPRPHLIVTFSPSISNPFAHA